MQIRIKDIKADAQDDKLSMRELKGIKKVLTLQTVQQDKQDLSVTCGEPQERPGGSSIKRSKRGEEYVVVFHQTKYLRCLHTQKTF